MRNKSQMGSSKFEYNPELLDERLSIRIEKYNVALTEVKNALENALNTNVDNNIVTRDSLQEYIIQELIKDFRNLK